MATSEGAIARMTHTLPLRWAGRCCDDDGEPTALGRKLWSIFHDDFKRDLDRMLESLIGKHPSDWYAVREADFRPSLGCGASSNADCNADADNERWITDENASSFGVEWAYVFTSVLALNSEKTGKERLCTMLVLSSYQRSDVKLIGVFGLGDPKAEWRIAAVVDLQGPEPNWERIQGSEPAACESQHDAAAPIAIGPENPPTTVALDKGCPHLYQVDVPPQEHHYVGFQPATAETQEVFCTCSPEAESASPDCIHARAVLQYRKEKRENARTRRERGLIYSGRRVRIGSEVHRDRTAPLTLVSEGESCYLLDPKPSQCLHNHSPSGFEWGYGGSGPAQLSLAILLDCLGDEQTALTHYQSFKAAHITPLPRDAVWELTGEQVEAFCRERDRTISNATG